MLDALLNMWTLATPKYVYQYQYEYKYTYTYATRITSVNKRTYSDSRCGHSFTADCFFFRPVSLSCFFAQYTTCSIENIENVYANLFCLWPCPASFIKPNLNCFCTTKDERKKTIEFYVFRFFRIPAIPAGKFVTLSQLLAIENVKIRFEFSHIILRMDLMNNIW